MARQVPRREFANRSHAIANQDARVWSPCQLLWHTERGSRPNDQQPKGVQTLLGAGVDTSPSNFLKKKKQKNLKRFVKCESFLMSLLNLLQYCFCYLRVFWPWGTRVLGIEPTPPAFKGEVPMTGPPGTSPVAFWEENVEGNFLGIIKNCKHPSHSYT